MRKGPFISPILLLMKLRHKEVKQPKAVRYDFHNWVEGDLRCDGLPVSSFRTDDWDDEADVKIGKEYDIK